MAKKTDQPKAVTVFGENNLTPKQQAFVNHPLTLTDPSAAAKAVGYSESFCKTKAYQLRRELAFYIEKKAAPAVARQEVSRNEILAELGAIATSNYMDFFEVIDTPEGSSMLTAKQNLKAMPVELQRQIKRISFETVVLPNGEALSVVSGIELYNKVDALKELVEILRLKQGASGERTINPLLENMPTKDLASLREIMTRATQTVTDAENKSKDKNAITTTKA